MLAWSAGLLPEVRPITLEGLIPRFDWARVKHEDLRLPAQMQEGA